MNIKLLMGIGIIGAALMSTMIRKNQASQIGIDLIKKWEGFESRPYKDVAGLKTIGYGTLLTRDHPLYNVEKITKEQAEGLLKDHLKNQVEPTLNNFVKVAITQNMKDALSSLIYNIGTGAFQRSTLLKLLNEGDYQGAADQFLRWNKARVQGQLIEVRGLTNRRIDEKNLFQT